MTMSTRCSILVVFFCTICGAAEKGDATEAGPQKVSIRGCVRTTGGAPVSGIEVRCFEIDPRYSYEFVWERDRQITDPGGQCGFSVLGDREYRITAGGVKSTFGRSERFVASSGRETTVETIEVIPATARWEGRILKEDGRPASGLLYACQSESFRPYRPFDYPQTDADGRFQLAVLPEEELSFWVVVEPNRAQMWTGLAPGSDGRDLRLDPRMFIDLPPEWKSMSDIEALARHKRGTKVRARIALTLPDLEGRSVSLPSARFQGKVVLVNLFGTWCGGCQAEMPHLVDFQQRYGTQGLEIVGIAFESDPSETAEAGLRRFAEKYNVNFPTLYGGQTRRVDVMAAVQGIERFQGYPTTIFIGRDGTVREVEVGFKGESPARIAWQKREFEKIILRLLKEPEDG